MDPNTKLDLKVGAKRMAYVGGIYPKRVRIVESFIDKDKKYYVYKHWIPWKRRWIHETTHEAVLALQIRLAKECIADYKRIGIKPPPLHLR